MATSAFGKAFREARASGDKTFMFNGKKYTTELAKPKTSTKPELGPEMGEKMTQIIPIVLWIFQKEENFPAHKNTQTTPQNQFTDAVYIHL